METRLTDVSRTRPPMSIVQALFQDPLTFDDDEIKIWLEADDRDDRLYQSLDHASDVMPDGVPFDLIPINKAADFAPGQVFVYLQGLHGGFWRADLMMISIRQPLVVFPDRRFVHGVYCEYNDMRLGDAWRFKVAGLRALEENGNVAWIGGIADFATRYMRRPARRTKPPIR